MFIIRRVSYRCLLYHLWCTTLVMNWSFHVTAKKQSSGLWSLTLDTWDIFSTWRTRKSLCLDVVKTEIRKTEKEELHNSTKHSLPTIRNVLFCYQIMRWTVTVKMVHYWNFGVRFSHIFTYFHIFTACIYNFTSTSFPPSSFKSIACCLRKKKHLVYSA